MGVLRISSEDSPSKLVVKLGRCALPGTWVSIVPSLIQPGHEERFNRRIVPGPPNLNQNQMFEPGARVWGIQAFITERNKRTLPRIPHRLGGRNEENATYF